MCYQYYTSPLNEIRKSDCVYACKQPVMNDKDKTEYSYQKAWNHYAVLDEYENPVMLDPSLKKLRWLSA